MKRILFLSFICYFGLFPELAAQKRGYEGMVEVGYAFGTGEHKNDLLHFSLVNGYRYNAHSFVGGGIGIGYSNAITRSALIYSELHDTYLDRDTREKSLLIPLFARYKFNVRSKGTSPYLLMDAGYIFNLNKKVEHFGFFLSLGIGVDFRLSKPGFFVQAGVLFYNDPDRTEYSSGDEFAIDCKEVVRGEYTTYYCRKVEEGTFVCRGLELKIGFRF